MTQRADSIAEFVVIQIRNFLLHYFMHQLVSIHFNVVTCSDVKQIMKEGMIFTMSENSESLSSRTSKINEYQWLHKKLVKRISMF